MRVTVTGGAGFIGSNLCSLLASSGIDVVVIDDLSTGYLENLSGIEVKFHKGSILDVDFVNEVTQGSDAIVHLAALGSVPRSVNDPLTSHDVNVTGTVNVLQAARNTNAHVIYASSSSVYGYVEDLPRVESLPTRPSSPYGASKLAAEGYVMAFGKTYGIDVLPLRFFNVYGPKQSAGHVYAAVVPTFIEAALKKQPIYIDGDGEQTRDFTYVTTVTNTILNALNRRLSLDMPVNLALGLSISINQLLKEIEPYFDYPLELIHRNPRVGDVRRSPSNPQRYNSFFNEVDVTPFEKGIEETINWFKALDR